MQHCKYKLLFQNYFVYYSENGLICLSAFQTFSTSYEIHHNFIVLTFATRNYSTTVKTNEK